MAGTERNDVREQRPLRSRYLRPSRTSRDTGKRARSGAGGEIGGHRQDDLELEYVDANYTGAAAHETAVA